MHLIREARVVHKDMLESRITFDGEFPADCQNNYIAPSLHTLVNIILDIANIKHQTQLSNTSTTCATRKLPQPLVFNSVKHARNVETTSVRHGHERETPLTLCLSLKMHVVTRSRCLINTLFRLGLC